MVWVGSDIPGRPAAGTYGTWPYATLPPANNHKFRQVHTLDDLSDEVQERMQESPTACYFRIDDKDGSFFHDQQDCAIWALDEATGGVFLLDEAQQQEEEEEEAARPATGPKTFVAKSLGEFLWRVDVENRCWFTAHDSFGGAGCEPGSREAADVAAYLAHYAELRRGTERELARLGCRRTQQWLDKQYTLRATAAGQLWRNAGVPSAGHAVLLDRLLDQLKFRFSFMGPALLEADSAHRLDAAVAQCNAAGAAAVRAWMLCARRIPRLDRNVALIIARDVFAARFAHY